MVATQYNTRANRTPWRVSRTVIDGCTASASGSGTSDISSCPSLTPPSLCIWNGVIGDIGQTTTQKFRETCELHASIDRIFSNDSNALSVGIQILRDEFSVSFGRNLYLHYRMDTVSEIVQPMGPPLVSHEVTTIDT